MKKQRTNLIELNILWRAACWCALVVGLMLTSDAAMAELILNQTNRGNILFVGGEGKW